MEEEDTLTLRHAKCFEITEMWAHHLSDAAKQSGDRIISTVPVFDSSKADDKLYESSATVLVCLFGFKLNFPCQSCGHACQALCFFTS